MTQMLTSGSSQFVHSGTICIAMLALASTVAYAADQESTPKQSIAQKDVADEADKSSDSTELSVPLSIHIDCPADRPDWLPMRTDHMPQLASEDHKLIVVTGLCDSTEECERDMPLMQRAAVASYVKAQTDESHFDFFPINDQWIEERLVTDTYTGTVMKGGVEMREQAVELTFTPEIREEITTAWNKVQVGERLGQLGGLLFVGTTLLICMSMFLCMLSRRAERKDSVENEAFLATA